MKKLILLISLIFYSCLEKREKYPISFYNKNNDIIIEVSKKSLSTQRKLNNLNSRGYNFPRKYFYKNKKKSSYFYPKNLNKRR